MARSTASTPAPTRRPLALFAAVTTLFAAGCAQVGTASFTFWDAIWSLVASLYLPCLYFVLRRPNEGRVPAWLEKWTCAFPRWLRGTVPAAN